jgi:hypothetical protein
MKLYFQIWKPGQISPPVSMEKQEAVFESLHSHAAQFGVTIEEKSDPWGPQNWGVMIRSGFPETEITPGLSATLPLRGLWKVSPSSGTSSPGGSQLYKASFLDLLGAKLECSGRVH